MDFSENLDDSGKLTLIMVGKTADTGKKKVADYQVGPAVCDITASGITVPPPVIGREKSLSRAPSRPAAVSMALRWRFVAEKAR